MQWENRKRGLKDAGNKNSEPGEFENVLIQKKTD